MIQVFSQLLSAALGSVGFGLIFNLNRRYLPAAGVGGLLAWLAYLLAANTLHSVFLANLLAGFCAALYAEILARCCNAPSTPLYNFLGKFLHNLCFPFLNLVNHQ